MCQPFQLRVQAARCKDPDDAAALEAAAAEIERARSNFERLIDAIDEAITRATEEP